MRPGRTVHRSTVASVHFTLALFFTAGGISPAGDAAAEPPGPALTGACAVDGESGAGPDGICDTDDDTLALYGPDLRCGTSDDRRGDGACDDIDNCPVTYNTTQTDSDSDGIGDACDCARYVSGTPSPPPVGGSVRAAHDAATQLTKVAWSPVPLATRYGTYRGTIPPGMMAGRLPSYDHRCFEAGDAFLDGSTTSGDDSAPPAGTCFYYAVSAESDCGESSLGAASNGVAIPNTFPCSGVVKAAGGRPPRIEPPPAEVRSPCAVNPAALPQGARADLPAYDGGSIRVTLPVKVQDLVSSDEVRSTVILPILNALGSCFQRGVAALGMPPAAGVSQPLAGFTSLAEDVADDYARHPELLRPKTQEMIDVFLGVSPPTQQIDDAMVLMEGMTFSQFVAGIERLEIQYAFQQLDGGVPIEHALLLASRWEGQAVTSVRGSLLNRYAIGNTVAINPGNAAAVAVGALRSVIGVGAVPFQVPDDGPALVLLPYGTDHAGITRLFFTYRMTLRGTSVGGGAGRYLLWLDAGSGVIRKLTPLLGDVAAQGEAFNGDPGFVTTLRRFQVNPAAGGFYSLARSGVFNRVDYLGDGFTPLDVTLSTGSPGSSGTFANFNQPAFNDETAALCASGTNKAFQQVSFYATLDRDYELVLGQGIYLPFPATPWDPKVEALVPGTGIPDCGAWADMRFGACTGYTDPACPDYSDGSFSYFNVMNLAHDAGVIGHELGHNVTWRLTQDRPAGWCCGLPACAPACSMPIGWDHFHDLADFWADHFETTNCLGGWIAKNVGGVDASLRCALSDESGYAPRLHQVTVPFDATAPADHFPEHRASGLDLCTYDDGQIAAAALWQVRLRTGSKAGPMSKPQFGVRYQRALKETGFFALTPPCSDKGIYDQLYDLEAEMVDQWATSGSPAARPAYKHDGPHATSRVAAGFARAGLFLVPSICLDGGTICPFGENGADAVIDIDDNDSGDDRTLNGVVLPEVDYLELRGPSPTFHVWTGPRYRLDGPGGVATLASPSPCNTEFKVEVATDPAFPPATTIVSPWIAVDTDPATTVSVECYGTWSPGASDWTTLQAGGALTPLYYRATTRDAAGASVRLTTSPGNGTWTVPPPYAILTVTGQPDY